MQLASIKKISLFDLIIYAIVGLFALFCILPLVLVFMGSITDEMTIVRNGYQLIPEKFSLLAYKTVFDSSQVLKSYGVSIFVTVVGTIGSLLVISSAAYGLSVKNLKYRRQLTFYFFFVMLFNGGLTPWYILIAKYLDIDNTIWVLIVPYLFNSWYMFIMRNYFMSIPEALRESACIDGANELTIMLRIILPVSTPVYATIGLFVALHYWNDWWLAILFIEERDLQPLQVLLRRIISQIMMADIMESAGGGLVSGSSAPPAYGIRMATTIITIGPIIFLYPFVQKYYVKGLILGSIKG